MQIPCAKLTEVLDIYIDHSDKIDSALYWLRSSVNPLTEAPYSLFNEDMKVIVLIHGTELVKVARKNETQYEEVIQRVRYYAN